jgi:hypothetical protein
VKTADEYIKEIKAAIDNDPVKALEVFNELTEIAAQTGNINVLMEVHKECGEQLVSAVNSSGFKEKEKEKQEKREQSLREEEERTGVWRLSRWPELKDRGVLGNGDLVELSISNALEEYRAGKMTYSEIVQVVNAGWDGLFHGPDPTSDRLKKIDQARSGLIFFEGKAMYVTCADRGPIPVFPDSKRRFKHCTISVISKAS